jgi:DNA topoisomerase-1
MTETEQLLEENKLIYVSGETTGIRREAKGNSYIYITKKGEEVKDEKTLDRIKRLAIPPAWQNVWIAERANAHLQATGIDAAGRKQYRYHPDWCRSRNENKYYRLLEFGKQLPFFRKNIAKDLKRKELDERKVLAISVNVMQKTLIRVGNETYKQLYGSYGLTTLRDKHVKIDGDKLKLSFRGKKGVYHEISLTDRNMARLVKKCRDIPGQELFQYYTDNGERKSIDSGKINHYIKEVTCCDFTAKDFRTWAGTLETLQRIAVYDYPENITLRKKIIVSVLDEVAAKLGNTRAICKKSYVFPGLLDCYENGEIVPYLKKISAGNAGAGMQGLNNNEKVLLSFLKAQRNKRGNNSKSK